MKRGKCKWIVSKFWKLSELLLDEWISHLSYSLAAFSKNRAKSKEKFTDLMETAIEPRKLLICQSAIEGSFISTENGLI
jgi:hypothetical protein